MRIFLHKPFLFSSIVLLLVISFPFIKNMLDTRVFGYQDKKIQMTKDIKPSPTPTITPTPTVVPTMTSTPTPTPISATQTPTPTSGSPVTISSSSSSSWSIQSVDAMKDTKDAVCFPRPIDWINKWLDKAVAIGANYVAIATPYDNPSCGDATAYTKEWVDAIRAHGLHVWHRHMPLAFEGIYNVQKSNSSNFLDQIKNYITAHPDLFRSGDIFTPIPEPQNGGIQGITNCANGVCQFSSAASFNQWLRDVMTASTNAFSQVGLSGQIKVGYFGFDGFITWGDNNPDWHGILEDATVAQMGNITIDHYPELVHETMSQGLAQLTAKYPHTPIVIGEWGTVTGGDTVRTIQTDMTAVKNDPNVVGFNYWQFGPSGSGEQLIDSSFNSLPGFSAVQSFYK